ncbi:outer membrane protein assembly factor BamE [Paroceanicella profunda]|uniref:Outer membrane protein assembly factor BamE n=1 Tax=Paroceanicella profunda TaxID=2579971 RepID=A0A5B8G256_9RHOB|nr:outer membrane protein assembly factor BamE [Paroceanicella profunda]QDL93369.1 outer membrane protein assembly factor BamE [Paroceanicella profunda]
MTLRNGLFVLTVAGCMAVSGCSPTYRGHGYAPKPEELSAIVAGQDTKSSVRTKIGRPGTQGLVSGDAWYYVGSTEKEYLFYAPEVIDRTVVVVLFDDQGTVQNVRQFGLEDGKVIDLVTRTTPTYGKELNVAQQLLGNIFNFNSSSLLQ